MKIQSLRPGMEKVDLTVTIVTLEEPRNVTTYSGFEHVLVEGVINDETGDSVLTVWNESIQQLNEIKEGDKVELINCFITSFQGVIQVNVGRDSEIRQLGKR